MKAPQAAYICGMDTIIFFCRKRDIDEPLTEAIGQKTYLLIRVGLNVGREQWFGWKLGADGAKGLNSEGLSAKGSGAKRLNSEDLSSKGVGSKGSGSKRPNSEGLSAKGSGAKRLNSESLSSKGLGSKGWDSEGVSLKELNSKVSSPGSLISKWFCSAAPIPGGLGGGKKIEPGAGGKGKIPFWKRLETRLGKRKIEKQNRLEQERRQTQQQAMTEQVRQEIRSLWADILALAGEASSCRCVYEDSVRDCLIGKKGKADALQRTNASGGVNALESKRALPEAEVSRGTSILQRLWEECWQAEEFVDYGQWEWMSPLLPQAVQHHFIILGNPSCGPELLEHFARQMKGLRWFLPEEEYTEELEDLLEGFYEEYGLAAALQLLPGSRPFSRLRLECQEPCNVLDFSEDRGFPSLDIFRDSVWIDMSSREEKARRLAVRSGVRYVSLKEYWKKLPKRTKPGFAIPRDTVPGLCTEDLPLFMRK